MAQTFALTTSMNTPFGAFAQVQTVSAGAVATVIEESIGAGTDTLVNIAFPYANVKAYYLYSSTDCTVETNATNASGGQTISLTGGVPKVWINGGDGSNVWSANVTKMYITNAADTEFTCVVLYDPTP